MPCKEKLKICKITTHHFRHANKALSSGSVKSNNLKKIIFLRNERERGDWWKIHREYFGSQAPKSLHCSKRFKYHVFFKKYSCVPRVSRGEVQATVRKTYWQKNRRELAMNPRKRFPAAEKRTSSALTTRNEL